MGSGFKGGDDYFLGEEESLGGSVASFYTAREGEISLRDNPYGEGARAYDDAHGPYDYEDIECEKKNIQWDEFTSREGVCKGKSEEQGMPLGMPQGMPQKLPVVSFESGFESGDTASEGAEVVGRSSEEGWMENLSNLRLGGQDKGKEWKW